MLLTREVLIEGREAAATIINRDRKRVKSLLMREESIRLLTSKAGNKAVEAIEAVAAEVDTEAIMIDIRTKRAVLIPSIETTRREVRTQKVPAVSSVSSRSSTPRELPVHTSNIIRTMITTTRAGTTAITKEIREDTPPSLLTTMALRS